MLKLIIILLIGEQIMNKAASLKLSIKSNTENNIQIYRVITFSSTLPVKRPALSLLSLAWRTQRNCYNLLLLHPQRENNSITDHRCGNGPGSLSGHTPGAHTWRLCLARTQSRWPAPASPGLSQRCSAHRSALSHPFRSRVIKRIKLGFPTQNFC